MFTPTQRRLLDALSDGLPHSRAELHAVCINDELSPMSNLRVHIHHLRKKLPSGELILCMMGERGKIFYRHVRMLKNPNDGKT